VQDRRHGVRKKRLRRTPIDRICGYCSRISGPGH
jgi:hypothetical protein